MGPVQLVAPSSRLSYHCYQCYQKILLIQDPTSYKTRFNFQLTLSKNFELSLKTNRDRRSMCTLEMPQLASHAIAQGPNKVRLR